MPLKNVTYASVLQLIHWKTNGLKFNISLMRTQPKEHSPSGLHNGPWLPRAAGDRLPGVHFQQIWCMPQFSLLCPCLHQPLPVGGHPSGAGSSLTIQGRWARHKRNLITHTGIIRWEVVAHSSALPFEQLQSFALHQLLYIPKQNRTGARASLPAQGTLTPSPGHPAGKHSSQAAPQLLRSASSPA